MSAGDVVRHRARCSVVVRRCTPLAMAAAPTAAALVMGPAPSAPEPDDVRGALALFTRAAADLPSRRETAEIERSVAVHNLIEDCAERDGDGPPPSELLHLSWGVLHPRGSLAERTCAVLEACLLGISTDEREILYVSSRRAV